MEGLFVLSEVQERMDEDPHSPVITCDTDEIEIPVDYTREQLMEGVHAEDQEDGDLTDEIITGQFSQFIDDGVSELRSERAQIRCIRFGEPAGGM